jgi:hypothetical protein
MEIILSPPSYPHLSSRVSRQSESKTMVANSIAEFGFRITEWKPKNIRATEQQNSRKQHNKIISTMD